MRLTISVGNASSIFFISSAVELLNASIKLWKIPRPKINHLHIPSNPCTTHAFKWTWDEKKLAMDRIGKTKAEYYRTVRELAMKNTRKTYFTFKTIHYDNKLTKEFKKIYHCYFPAKEDDFVFTVVSNAEKPKHKNV